MSLTPSTPLAAATSRLPNSAWHAYSIGRRGPLVGRWLDQLLDAWRFDIPPEGDRRDRPPALGPFDDALRTLATRDRVRGPILVELHRTADVLHATCRRLWRRDSTGGRLSNPRLMARAEEHLAAVDILVQALFDAETGVTAWADLGVAMGRCRRFSQRAAAHPRILDADEVAPLVECVNRITLSPDLTALRDLPRRVEVLAADRRLADGESTGEVCVSLVEVARRAHAWNRDLARYDLELEHELKRSAPYAPTLVLCHSFLTFRGERVPIHQLSSTGMAALRVLIEKADTWVERSVIKREARIQSDVDQIPVIFSRLRRNFKSLRDRQRSAFESLGRLIRGGSSGSHRLGPYRLLLDPAEVQLTGEHDRSR